MPRRPMSETERRLLGVVLVVATFASVVLFVDVPLYNESKRLEGRSAEERRSLSSVVALSDEYRFVRAELDETRGAAFTSGTSLAGLDAAVGRGGLKKKMASVKSTTRPVAEGLKGIRAELAFDGISLGDLAGVLAALEADGHPVSIERVSIKATYEDPAAFNATLIVNTVERE
jgi:hypothetical protein